MFQGARPKRKVTPATVNRYIALIHSILNAAYQEWGWLELVPYLSKPGQAGERQRKAWLTPEQFVRLVNALPEHIAVIAKMAVATGMREDNIIHLNWNQVDLARRRVVIPAREFKGKCDHVVPLNDTALSVIRTQIGKHPQRVFTKAGKTFESINLRLWHHVCDQVGINAELRADGLLRVRVDEDETEERFVFHGLRHTFATWLGLAGVPLEVVELIGGWSIGPRRVVLMYSHLANVGHLLPFACKIDEVLAGKIAITNTKLAQD